MFDADIVRNLTSVVKSEVQALGDPTQYPQNHMQIQQPHIRDDLYSMQCSICRPNQKHHHGQIPKTSQGHFTLYQLGQCTNLSQSSGAHKCGGTFLYTNHSVDNVTIEDLEFIHANPDSDGGLTIRTEREKYWIYQHKSLVPLGINATDGSNHSRSCPIRPRMDVVDRSQTNLRGSLHNHMALVKPFCKSITI